MSCSHVLMCTQAHYSENGDEFRYSIHTVDVTFFVLLFTLKFILFYVLMYTNFIFSHLYTVHYSFWNKSSVVCTKRFNVIRKEVHHNYYMSHAYTAEMLFTSRQAKQPKGRARHKECTYSPFTYNNHSKVYGRYTIQYTLVTLESCLVGTE